MNHKWIHIDVGHVKNILSKASPQAPTKDELPFIWGQTYKVGVFNRMIHTL